MKDPDDWPPAAGPLPAQVRSILAEVMSKLVADVRDGSYEDLDDYLSTATGAIFADEGPLDLTLRQAQRWRVLYSASTVPFRRCTTTASWPYCRSALLPVLRRPAGGRPSLDQQQAEAARLAACSRTGLNGSTERCELTFHLDQFWGAPQDLPCAVTCKMARLIAMPITIRGRL
jgi:hypothetical protein